MGIFDTIGKFLGLITEEPQQVEPKTIVRKTNRRTSNRTTKIGQVRQHLILNGSITSWEAIELYGATRLSAFIFIYRNDGMEIVSEPASRLDRNGNVCNYVIYKYNNGTN